MNISKKMQDAISTQVKHEIYSAYLYLSMSVWCDKENRPGCAHWLKLQWQEELAHAERFMTYLNRRGGSVTLEAINKPPSDFGSLLQLFEQVLEHEQSVTAKINKLYEMAQSEKDYATEGELQWFITEQVEEEESATDIIELLKQVGDHGPSLLMLDRQLGQRTAGGGE
jgi:ferritin